MNLYEINEKLMDLIDEDGEISDFESFEALAMERDEKIKNIACWIKNLRSDAEQLKTEIEALTKRKKKAENKANSLLRYLEFVLGGKAFKSTKVEISYITSSPLAVEDGFVEWANANAPDLISTSAPEVDKNAVKRLLAQGEKIPFVHLEERLNMQIK